MPVFDFTAIGPAGDIQHGTLEAATSHAVVEALQRDGLIPMRAEPAGRRSFLDGLMHLEMPGTRGLSREAITQVTRELATMLAAGQDIDRALRFVRETARDRKIIRVIDAVREKVRGGTPLAAALAAPPASFPKLYVGLVRAGESGGNLAETLDHLAGLMERERRLAATVTSALIYPVLLLAAALGTVFLLVGYVLPQFAPIFEQNGLAMPWSTRLLLSFGGVMTTGAPWGVLALLLLILGGRWLLGQPAWRLRWDRLLLHLPIAGSLLRETAAARLCRTLGTLLTGGLPLVAALGIVRDTLSNLAVVAALDAATLVLRGGGGLAQTLGDAKVLPVRTIHLLRLGEESAQLARVALIAAEIHEEQVRVRVQRLVSLLVPVITIGMGAAVAGIVGSLMMAMLSLNDLAN
ncbi:MAG TPA: type II secretion system F family protein [Stellaceae bacterium]|jgi:general secretion pathway protein F|nr:type II secretion system F family protein [Stellaceae bacterium]